MRFMYIFRHLEKICTHICNVLNQKHISFSLLVNTCNVLIQLSTKMLKRVNENIILDHFNKCCFIESGDVNLQGTVNNLV